MRIEGRVALVTGASGGLGHTIARHVAHEGARLVLTARRTDVLERLAAELDATTMPCDLADPASAAGLVEQAGEIDLLIANAGVDAAEDLVDLGTDEIARTVAVNLTAPAVLAAGFARGMARRGNGHIVLIASMAGKIATVGNGTLYTATKWGLRGLGLGLREELRGTGVGVSTIFPGPISDSGMFADTGVPLPNSIKANTSLDVAHAVLEAVEHDRGEVDVASPLLRFAGAIGAVTPSLVGRVSRQQGAGEVRRQMVAARRTPDPHDKRSD